MTDAENAGNAVLTQDLPLSTNTLLGRTTNDAAFYAPCATREDPTYLAHLNAPALARDIDLVRNLTGYSSINFYGQSYGSVVGIAYAGLFPARVGKMVLDCTST